MLVIYDESDNGCVGCVHVVVVEKRISKHRWGFI